MSPLPQVKPVSLWPTSSWRLAFISPSRKQCLLWRYPTSVLPGNDYSRLSGFLPRTWIWSLTFSQRLSRPSHAFQPSQSSLWLLAFLMLWPNLIISLTTRQSPLSGDSSLSLTASQVMASWLLSIANALSLCLSGHSLINALRRWPKALTACTTSLIFQTSQCSLGYCP